MGNSDKEIFNFAAEKGKSSIIKVIGVGGGGNNALRHMHERGIHGVDFVICNTDAQTLDESPVSNKVQLGVSITEGLGAGADPEVGEKAAIESIDDIKNALGNNTKMVFITAGMGGGTGTGAAPVVAKVAKEMGILTVAIVTVPFSFEGKRRIEQADAGLEKLKENVDSLIVINNNKVAEQFPDLDYEEAFFKADEVLTNAAKGMSEVITAPFKVNIDFRDAKSVLQNSGTALMSIGIANGEKRAEEAVRKALDSPLLNNNKITGAKNVLLLILSGSDDGYKAKMSEISLISQYIQKEAGGENEANVILGIGKDEELGDAIKVLVIATGFAKENAPKDVVKPVEKVIVNLDDKVEREERVSPFQSRAERTSNEAAAPNVEVGKSVFKLDDEEDSVSPQFKGGNVEAKPMEQFLEVETMTFEEEFSQNFDGEEEKAVVKINLFTDEEEEKENSFIYDEQKTFVERTSEEQPMEFIFEINESEENDPFVRIKEVKEEDGKFSIREEIPTPDFKVESSVVDEIQDEVVEQVDEFKFISKTPFPQSKTQERRDKLKAFNSRYQNFEQDNEFENVPAFRRKNIDIDGFNASEQTINTYISEDNKGNISVRENRFLNKDVD